MSWSLDFFEEYILDNVIVQQGKKTSMNPWTKSDFVVNYIRHR